MLTSMRAEKRKARSNSEVVGTTMVLCVSVVGTFLALRLALAYSPNADLSLGGYNIHHLFTGIILTTVTAVPLAIGDVSISVRRSLVAVLGIGLACMLDEWVYLIATDGSNASYSLPVSYWGGTALVSIVTVFSGLYCAARLNRGRR